MVDNDIFEQEGSVEEADGGVVMDLDEEMEEETAPIKAKKARKPLTEARKQQLREQLKRGRETSLAKRTKGKAKKDLVKLKVEESKVEKIYKQKVHSDMEKEQALEDKLTKKIIARMKKEAEEEARTNEIISLRAQVAELKKPKAKPKLETIKEEPRPATPAPVVPKYNKFSPSSNHFMGGFY